MARNNLAIRAVPLALCVLLAACGSRTGIVHPSTVTVTDTVAGPGGPVIVAKTPQAAQRLGFPVEATKNTTRVAGGDPVADAAGVALAVFPSSFPGTKPRVVTLAPTDDWQAALASAVFMASPIKAPILLSGRSTLPPATATALKLLSPSGSGAIGGNQLIRVGDVPAPRGVRAEAIAGSDPFALAAAIDRFASAVTGHASNDVVIASGENSDAAYAMPAAGWAAESGDPILFVTHTGIPQPTRQALLSHARPHLYVLGPPSAVPDAVLKQLSAYGTVKRIAGTDPAGNSVAFATYRDPACPFAQACVHVPGSFGWALRSPGHGYTILNGNRVLDAAASAPLSASGQYGPQLVLETGATLAAPITSYFQNYATPGFTQEGPTAAVYNHGWIIGDQSAISPRVQAEVDSLLEAVPVR
jgi:ell wall binding domain 2 (CWB2)